MIECNGWKVEMDDDIVTITNPEGDSVDVPEEFTETFARELYGHPNPESVLLNVWPVFTGTFKKER